jgi:hypothetical protein
LLLEEVKQIPNITTGRKICGGVEITVLAELTERKKETLKKKM